MDSFGEETPVNNVNVGSNDMTDSVHRITESFVVVETAQVTPVAVGKRVPEPFYRRFFVVYGRKIRSLYTLVGGFMFAIVVFIIAAVVVTQQKQHERKTFETADEGITTQPSSNASDSNTPILDTMLKLVGPLYGQSADILLQNQSSPQGKALQWLTTNDTNLYDRINEKDDDDELLLQRYALVVLYYSTNGDSWVDRCSFLSSGKNECYWNSGSINQRIGITSCDEMGRVLELRLGECLLLLVGHSGVAFMSA